MSCHPCCGNPLQTWTKVVAAVEIIGSICMIFVIGSGIIGSMVNANGTSALDKGLTPNSSNSLHLNVTGLELDRTGVHLSSAITTFLAVLSILVLILSVCSLLMAVLLYVGAHQKNAAKCRIWLIFRCILVLTGLTIYIIQASFIGFWSSIYGYGVEYIINFYCISVVYTFINELREEEGSSGRPSVYTNM